MGPARLSTLTRIYAWVVIGIGLEMLGVAMANHIPLRLIATEMGKFTDLGWGRSNYVAAVAALATAAVLPSAFQKGNPHRKLALAALVSAVFVTVASASRGGIVALLFSVILGLTLGRLNVVVTFLLLGGGVFLLFVSPFGQEHFLGPKGLPSIGARLLFFREAIRIALSHPWAGVGPDQIPFHTYFYMDANPHNIFLKQAADLGLVGLGLYLLLLGTVGRHLVRLYHAGHTDPDARFQFSILFLVFFTALVNASYEPTLEAPQYGFLYWLIVGTLIPARRGDEAT
jgi:O-antigen ligase